MHKLWFALLWTPVLGFAESNTFIEQDLSKIKQQNQQVQQRLTESSQAAAQEAQSRAQSFNSRAMQTILYSGSIEKASGSAATIRPPAQHAPAAKAQPQQFTTPVQPSPASSSDNLTGLNSDNQQQDNQSNEWNYGF